MFFQNPANPLIEQKNINISPDFTRLQWTVIFILWLLIFPICIPLWLISKILIGTLVFSGQIVFWFTHRIFRGHPDPTSSDVFKWQCVRAYINNCIAVRLPHWNWPFRKFLFRLSGIQIGKNGLVGMGGYMEDYRPENVVLEDNVAVSFGVTFIAHGVKKGLTEQQKYIILRSGAYIGAGSILLPGIEVGSNAVVGSGSIVTKDIPAGAIVAGCPARVIKYKPGYEPLEQ